MWEFCLMRGIWDVGILFDEGHLGCWTLGMWDILFYEGHLGWRILFYEGHLGWGILFYEGHLGYGNFVL